MENNALTRFRSAGAVLADGLIKATAEEMAMPEIGTFTNEEAGFIGYMTTLVLNQDVVLIETEPSDVEHAPHYRVHVFDGMHNEAGAEIGAGWKRTGEKAGEYVALVIDDPTLPQPIRANLFRNDDTGKDWSLHWSRLQKRDGKD